LLIYLNNKIFIVGLTKLERNLPLEFTIRWKHTKWR